MSTQKRLPNYRNTPLGDVGESLGITRFSGTSNWDQAIGGLIFQGGKTAGAGAISFHVPIPKQLLFVSLSGGSISGESLTGFTASGAGYWFAIGV